MTSNEANYLDLIAKRYSIRPSQILNLDSWTGFQLDSALAAKFDIQDKEFLLTLVDLIRNDLVNIARAMGAKGAKFKPHKPILGETSNNAKRYVVRPQDGELPTVAEVLNSYGYTNVGTSVQNTIK